MAGGPINWSRLFSPTAAEARLLELLRGDRKYFALTIKRDGDRWLVRSERTGLGQVGVTAGTGSTFLEAWDDLKPGS